MYVGLCAHAPVGASHFCMGLCAHAPMGRHTSTFMWRPSSASDALTRELTALFLRQTLLLNLEFKIQLSLQLASEHQRSKILASQGWDD